MKHSSFQQFRRCLFSGVRHECLEDTDDPASRFSPVNTITFSGGGAVRVPKASHCPLKLSHAPTHVSFTGYAVRRTQETPLPPASRITRPMACNAPHDNNKPNQPGSVEFPSKRKNAK
eukprot:GHVT01086785.1.p1 GENE.GHVT01086785.1~~GHVT01086785.1.p1  ORF type:complete len:118 (-),score=6.92 GHVT01086785.1:939-1292(-)